MFLGEWCSVIGISSFTLGIRSSLCPITHSDPTSLSSFPSNLATSQLSLSLPRYPGHPFLWILTIPTLDIPSELYLLRSCDIPWLSRIDESRRRVSRPSAPGLFPLTPRISYTRGSTRVPRAVAGLLGTPRLLPFRLTVAVVRYTVLTVPLSFPESPNVQAKSNAGPLMRFF